MSRSMIAAIVLAVAAAAGLAFYLLRPGASSTGAEQADRGAPPAAASAPGPLTAAARPELPASPAATAPADAMPGAPAVETEGVTVTRGATVATVNGVAITGADVVPFGANAGASLQISREMYDYLTRRAIERELTFQAARARKLELGPADNAQVAQARKLAEERGETDPAQLAFEEEDAKAHLLLAALAQAEGAPPSMPDDKAVDAYLKANAAELGPVPADAQAAQQQRVMIRQKLYAEMTAAHQKFLRALIARLEAEARITR